MKETINKAVPQNVGAGLLGDGQIYPPRKHTHEAHTDPKDVRMYTAENPAKENVKGVGLRTF